MNPKLQNALQPHLAGVDAYTPGRQPVGDGWIKLNTNESPFAPTDAVLRAIAAESVRLAKYPSPTSAPLRAAIAQRFGMAADQVIIGNGSDDILNLLVRAFGGIGRATLQTFPSYSLYPVITALAAGAIESIEFSADFALPLDRLIACRADLLLLTAPNAPTGVAFPLHQLQQLAAEFAGVLVIDEAYADFADHSAVSLLGQYNNVFITRTFSKAYGLAGLRVGYGLGPSEGIAILDKIRDSYNVNRLSQAGAMAAFVDEETHQQRVAAIRKTRERVRQQLLAWKWAVYPSSANFLFAAPVTGEGVASSATAEDLFSWLEQRKILVRRFPSHPLTAPYLRISIGSDLEMDAFLQAAHQWTQHVVSA